VIAKPSTNNDAPKIARWLTSTLLVVQFPREVNERSARVGVSEVDVELITKKSDVKDGNYLLIRKKQIVYIRNHYKTMYRCCNESLVHNKIGCRLLTASHTSLPGKAVWRLGFPVLFLQLSFRVLVCPLKPLTTAAVCGVSTDSTAVRCRSPLTEQSAWQPGKIAEHAAPGTKNSAILTFLRVHRPPLVVSACGVPRCCLNLLLHLLLAAIAL
jgi:hypothetical protein